MPHSTSELVFQLYLCKYIHTHFNALGITISQFSQKDSA